MNLRQPRSSELGWDVQRITDSPSLDVRWIDNVIDRKSVV